MIPVLNMNSIHCHTTVAIPAVGGSGGAGLNSSGSGSGGPRLATGRQISPRTSYLTSPGETSSLPSAHLQRRAADVASVLEMNPLQCHSVGDLQRKLIETAEWVVKLRHWYTHQLQERDLWCENRLRGLEDSFRAALAASTAAGTAHATAGAGAVYTATEGSFTEHAAPSTISASRAVASGAPAGSAIAATASAPADKEAGSGTPLRHRSRAHKNSASEVSEAGANAAKSSHPVERNQAAAAAGTAAGVAGGGHSGDGCGSAPLRAGSPKRSALLPIAQDRLTASAGSPGRQPLHPEDNEPPCTSVAAIVINRGESRPTLAARAVAVTTPGIVEGDYDAPGVPHHPSASPHPRVSRAGSISFTSSTVRTQVIGIPAASAVRVRRDVHSSRIPLSGRPASANALLSTAGAATESPGRLSARAGGSGGRRSDVAQSERRGYYASLSRTGSGSINISLPHCAQYLDANTSRNPIAAEVNTGNSATDVAAPAFHKTAPHFSKYLYLLTSGDDNHSRKPKRRSLSSSGGRHVSRVYPTREVKQSATGHGASSQHRKGTGNTDASRHSSPSCFIRQQSWT
ncbi:conserved hypothetical protein [Leishmania major strain Friedlin]|uniref:Uncharacterized protein n=1 Tax=Leishmania major TaxID=5664 RepID=Q4QJ36_LEIMA|nr:conserved hypothetical protein [Leishmania major strain Friedlin]CAG9568837.1 hypothetical_protein_-_conserved [Leishmania major strain Friedlin]CAJ02087.1 conserved hypothetical protein [Leishmania major strain Friedlin]|eukprot:XP_001680812.1 conserved hypothetical protein [Leishmania major strain Friedlin]